MGGKEPAEEGLSEEEWEQGGARRGDLLQERYPKEGTGQWTVYSQTIPQRGPCP